MPEQQPQLSSAIEAFLFSEGVPVKKTLLASLLGVDDSTLSIGVTNLHAQLKNRGIVLVETNGSLALRSAPEFTDLLKKINLSENSGELSKAALEVLSVIVYKDGVSLAEIDYIRGVNSSYSVRKLLTRGLIEFTNDDKDSRKKVYQPTVELFSYLGITDITDLPEFESVKKQIKEFEDRKEE